MLVSDARGFEAKAHAVGSPLPVQEQTLIGFQLDQENAAQVRDSEPALKDPMAELDRVKILANQLEQLLQFGGRMKCEIDTLS